ncbi:hypothetical protein [Paenibacillus sp. Pae108]|uniref:hypothetical protein n=1 Tax=Paenibacillus sp. Pae108 TaxID=2926019 RepID=UPI002118BF72|nr:hypothetical protein [Paenibacillus sp. Pae108]
MEEISYEQLELFPLITGTDSDRTQILLEQFRFMKKFIKEFEENGELLYLTDIEGEKARKVFQDETHADKTANAVVLHEIRKWRYNEFRIAVTNIEMAHRMILDEEARDAIEYRYFRGLPVMRAALELKMQKSTFSRRLNAGIESIGNTLKMMGVLDRKWTF